MHDIQRNTEDQEEQILSLFESCEKLVFNHGWSRRLLVEQLPGGDLVRIRAQTDYPDDYSEEDIVGLFSEADYRLEKIDLKLVLYECRQFIQKHSK